MEHKTSAEILSNMAKKGGMNYLGLIGRFFPKYKGSIGLNILFMALSSIFSIVGFSAVIPIINMLFGISEESIQIMNSPASSSFQDLFDFVKNNTLYYLQGASLEHGTGYGLMIIALFIIITSLLSNGCSFLAEFFRIPMRVGILRDLRKELYNKILDFPASLMSKDNRGDLVSRTTNDVLEVEWCVNNTLDLLIEHPIPVIIYLITLFTISPKLTLFAFVLLMLCALIVIVIGRSLKRLAHKGQSERGTILSQYEETIGGLTVIRSFNAEKQASERFDEINEENRRTFRKLNRVLALSSPVTRFTVSTVLAVLLWFGGNSILSGGTRLSGAEFVYFLLIFHSIIAPVRGIAKASYSIRKQVASLERINKVLNMEDGQTAGDLNDNAVVKIEPDVPAIEFSHVSYSYEDDAPVLEDFSFVLEQGSSIAIVGSVGVGKTTAAELAIKLFTPQAGGIKVYGKDITTVSATSIRKVIGFVPQDAVLFNDTVFNNIALGADKASVKDVEEAAKKAGIHEFIMSLPEGYDTVVGDRGSRLSGGQKQQIALARAFLKDAPILILDEATASLDPETAASIMDVITELMQSRSTMLITHDEKVAAMADSIVKLS